MLAPLSQALVGLALWLGPVSTDALAANPCAAADKDEDTIVVPTVRVEIKLPGAVLKSNYQRLEWDMPDAVELERGDAKHRVDVTVAKRDDNGRKLTLTVSYEQDGRAVIAPFTFDTTAKKREILSTEGGVALAITVKPKKVAVEKTERDEDEQLDGHQSDDPLDGL